MKKLYSSSIFNVLFIALISVSSVFTASATDWLYGCGDNMTVELEYLGINNNVPASLSFSNSGNIDHIVAEIVYKGCNPGSSITIQDASNNSYTAYRQQPSGTSSNVWVYRTTIPSTSSISYSNQYNESCVQSLVAYVFRQQPNAGQTAGTFTGRSGYNDVQTVTIPIPTDAAARDLTLYVPMSEMTTDGRYIHLSANAGGSTASVTERIYSSSLPNGCCIKVFELNLTNVPANTSTVTLTIDTRHNVHQSCNGQSWVLAAAVYTDIECVGCDADISQVALHDLGSNTNTALVDGATYTLASLPTNWNVEALVSGSTVGSVKFTWSGDYSATNTENSYPYRTPTDEAGLNLGAGSYTLNVKTYTGSGCTGSQCDEQTIHFTITGCDNVTNAGQIGYAQTGCSPFDPAEIVSVQDPSGGSGALEFVWLKSTNGGTNYTAISGANGLTYNPGPITQDTWYRRCSRRAGCTQYVGESNWVKMTVGTSGVSVNVSGTDVSCNSDDSHECQAVHYQNGTHAIWINTLPNTSTDFKFENNSGKLIEYPNGTARITGIIYNTSNTDKRWAVDVYLNDKKTWSQWQAAGGSWKGNATTVGSNYQNWAYYEMDASQSRLIGLGYYAGKELNIQRMAMAPQFRVQVGTAANDKNGNYGASLWFDYSGDFTGHGDFNFDLQNCVDHGCDGAATASASGGTAPYLYVWDNGATTSSLEGLCAGQYCVSVTDANGCTSDEVCVTIGQQTPCCDNVTNGGEIAQNQSNCGPFDVAELTSVSAPSGGTGDLEIVWITRLGTSGTWQMIAGANGLTYDPGVVSATTQFRRCARREGCTDYIGESNIITVTVYPSFTLACNSSDASAWEAEDGTVGITVNGGTAPYTYLWNTGATTASVPNVPAGVYSVTVTDANGCQVFTECCVKQPPMPQVCIGFRTQTPGGWGATPNGGNPGAYLHANFAAAFPSGIEIGCTNKFRFTTAQAITDFLPCGGTATGLPAGTAVNPACPGNVLAGHVLAATISVGFDNAIPSFSTSTVPLQNLIIRYGTFQGWTVGQLLLEANRKLGGCSSSYSYSQLVEGVSSVNENYVDGNVTGNYLDCCSLTASCTKVDGTCSNNNQGSASVSASGGTAPYAYLWSNGATTASISGLAAGTYSVTITDATGCEATCSKTVSVVPCCNVTDPGSVAGSQSNCGPFDPAAFTSVAPATGGLGDVEYQWYSKETETAWMPISGATGETYDPGIISVNTQFKRCAKRANCPEFDQCSNVLEITIYPNNIVATCSQTPAACAGASTGSASVAVQGGTGPYSYLWSNGATTASISGLAAGTYSVTVTDANGCTGDCSVQVGEANSLVATCSKVDGNCGNNNQGSASVSVSGGTAPFTYAWSNGATTASINGLTVGSYSVTVTDANGCTNNCSVSVTTIPCCNVTDPGEIAANQNNCGSFDPVEITSVSAPSGGLGALEIVWITRPGTSGSWTVIPGATGLSYDPGLVTQTTQFRRCARRAGCTEYIGESNIITITVYPSNMVANCSSTDVDCNGASNGSASVVVSGGTAPYTVLWSTGATTMSISNLMAGSYSVTVTDANGCTTTCSADVEEPSDLAASCSKVDGSCSNNNQGSASVVASGGTAPYTYAWSNGATSSSISGLAAGTYSVTVTDANGCTENCSATVTITPCCNVTNGGQIAGGGSNCGPFDPAPITSASLPTGGLGDLEYVWLWNTQNVVNNGNSGWVEIPNSNSATYDPGMLTETRCFLRCSRRSGCTAYVGESNIICFTVNPDNMVATCTPVPVDCNGASNGSVSVSVQGGTAPYSYAWSNGGTTATISGLAAGSYSVTITDANGCTSDCSATVSEPSALSATCGGEDIDCYGESTGSVSVSAAGGTAPYSYLWSNGATTASVENLPAGTYSVTVTDANGCTTTCSKEVEQPQGEIVLSCNSSDASAWEATDGSVGIIVSGGTAPYTYLWNTGATTASISNVPAGVYSVTVTDANGCQQWTECCVKQPPFPEVCIGFRTQTPGGWGAVPNGGNPGAYLHANFTTAFPSGIEIGCTNKFRFTTAQAITDFLPCGGTATGLPAGIATNPACPGNVLAGHVLAATISVGFDNAIPNFSTSTVALENLIIRYGTFQGWTVGQLLLEANRKLGGCTSSYSYSQLVEGVSSVNENYVDGNVTGNYLDCCSLTASCTSENGTCANGNHAEASVTASGGTAPYTYVWSNGATTASIEDLASGTYSVTVIDATGCNATCQVTVSVVPCCNVTDPGSVAGNQSNCGPFDPVAFTSVAPATGGLGDVVYQWYSKETETAWMPIAGANGETYDPGMISVNTQFKRCAKRASCPEFEQCSNVLEITIYPDNIIATCTPSPADCNGSSTGSVSVAVQGGTSPYTYVWSNGATTATVNGLAAGNYSVTVTDVNGCTQTCSAEVEEPSDLTATCAKVDGTCSNNNQASVSVTAAGGTAPYTYLWSNGSIASSISGLAAGTYSVTVTDANGCTETCSKTVTITPCCNVTNGGQIAGGGSNCGPFDPAPITSASLPTGGLGDLEYVWLWNTQNVPNNGNSGWVEIPNSNSATYDPGMLTETRCFLRCARRSGCTTYIGESNIICFTVYPDDMVATCTPTDADCNGASTGSVSVAVTGGTAPYTVLWSTGATTMSVSNLMAGSYSVTVTDANGCTTTCSTDVDEPSDLSINCSKVDGTCSNNNQASASVSASGGTAPYTYAWSNGATTSSIDNLAAGTYSITVTDANGCTDNCSVTVSITPCCNVTNGGQIAGGGSNCGPFDPAPITSASLPTGGLGDLEYVWLWNTQNVVNNGNSGWVEIPNSNAATYDPGMLTETRCFLRCARRSGCTTYVGESNIICFTVNPEPTASCSKVDGTCANGNQASASVSVSGGTAPYTYAWSNGATTASISGLADGTYSVTVTDANGCSDDCSVTVSTVPCCNVTDPGTVAGNQSNCGPFDPVAFTNVAPATGGLGDIVYQWYSKETETAWMPIAGANGETYDPGMISVNTQFKRCAKRASCPEFEQCSNVLEITIYPDNIIATCTPSPVDCNGGSTGSVSVAVQGGTAPYSYSWSNGGTSATISGLAAGSYSVTITDANGCTSDCSAMVTEPSTLSATCSGDDVDCYGESTGEVSVSAAGGTAPYIYLWSNGATTASVDNLPAGTYSVTVTDANGCTATCSHEVDQPQAPLSLNCNADDADCNGASTGSASVTASGGHGPYTYAWSNGATTASISGLAAGSYSVTVTDHKGCTETCNVTVGEPSQLTATCGGEDIDCYGESTGEVSVSAAGGTAPYTYLWSNGATTASVDNLPAGTYSVTVTDANGCTATCSKEVEQPQAPVSLNCSAGDTDCNGASTGSASVSASGGTAPYTYLWSNGPTTASVNGLAAGSYSVTVTDSKGCEETCSVTVGEPSAVAATCSSTNGTCANNNVASASVSAAGGTAPYTYLWSNGATTASISNLADGTYSVTVTDANGCSDDCSVTVSTTPCCDVTDSGEVAGSQEGCGPFDPVAFTSVAPATGGLGNIVYQWYQKETETAWMPIPGANGETYDPGMIYVNSQFRRCARREGCPEFVFCSNVLEIEIHPIPQVNCTSVSGNCSNGNGASASVNVQGGTSPYTFAWSNGGTTQTIGNLAEGTYSVTVTDYFGCSATCSVNVTVEGCCNVTDGGQIAGGQENCGPFDPAAITSVAPATGGIGPVEYVWLWNSQNVPVNNGNNGWVEIPNSNSETFDPGMLTETRCFIRCARNVGCTTYIGESNVICMVVNPVPVATCTPVNGDCNNNNSASASVSVSGGTSPYSYLWSNGETTASISGLADGTYSVTVTDINGCSDDCSVTVTTNPCCDVTEPGEVAGSQSGCGAFDPVAFTSIAPATGGLGGIEYQWYQKETETAWMPIPGATGETYDPGMISVNSQFRRCARRTGCPEFEVCSNVLEIEIYPVPNAFCTKEDGNCNNGNLGSVSVTAQGGTGPYTYLWSTSTGSAQANGATTASINGLAAGTYSVTVTDQNGCTATCSKTVSVNPCCNVTDGGDIAGGQENCGPFDPAAITSIAPASGGLGNLEYIWLMNDENVPLNNGQNGWVEIPGSNSETYDPGMITETTCFIRCARREGCTTYVGESNVICMVVNDSPVASCSSTDSGCNGSGTGTATVTATGGEAPYTYAWSNGGTTATISGLMAGGYSVTVTDANGCTDVCTAVVGEPSGLSATCDATDATCNGEDNGSLSVNATGGSAPYTYLWSNGATTSTVDNVGAGSYSVTVTDANGCTATCSSTVSEPSALSASCSKVDGSCQNNNQGSASVSVSGGVEPYTVLWSTGATTMSISNLMAGSYSVTVTDANGCEATCNVIVENTPCCNVTDGGEIAGGQSNCGPFDPAALTSVAPATGGIGPVEYVWLWNANNVPLNNGQNGWVEIPNSNSETFDPGMLTESRCFIRCARNQGCVPYIGESNVVCITIYPQPVATCTPDNGSCNNGNVSSASVSVSGGTEPYTYLWSNGATTASISNLADGTYSVTVTDANGCSDDCSVTVSSTPCCNVTDGGEIAGSQENCGPFDPAAITSVAPATGGIGPVEYVWLWNSQNVPINNGNNGWVEIPNSNSETYDPGMLTESRCFIRCARNQGCVPYIGESNVICITINEAPVVSCTSTSGDCNNGNTASASVSVTGGEAPYTYVWSNGATTATIDSLATGTYSVTVTDANGCEASCSTSVQLTGCCNVTDPGEIGYDQENCGPFDADELVSLADPTGGLGNLEIVWITRPGTSGVWQLIPGANGLTYDPGMITTTTQFRRCVQREGCSEMEETPIITITIFPQPEVVCNPTHGDCSNNGVGAVSTSISGGTAPFTYVWSTGATTADISGLGEGTYSVTVTDANGCTTECSVDVMSEPCCNVTDGGEIAGSQSNCGPFDPAAITSVAPATGGIGPVEYVWLWNANNVPINNGNNGWVMIPNSNSETYDPGMLTESRCFLRCARNVGCENYIGESNVVCITVNPVPQVLCTKDDGSCANNNVASIYATTSNGTEPYTYLWSNGETTASITNLVAGTYSVTVTDANGCEATCSKTVSIIPCCNVTDGGEIAGVQSNCGPFDPAAITSVAPATGGIGPVEYVWLWNSQNVPINNGNNGWVEIPNSNSETYDPGYLTESRCFLRCARNVGCEVYVGESNVVCITINPIPEVACTKQNGNCVNNRIASVSVVASGGTEPYTYLWSNGETTSMIDSLEAGTYTVTVTDANGCEASCSRTVSITECCNVTDGGEIAGAQSNCGPFDPAALTSVAPATGGIGPVEYVWLWNSQNVPINNGNNGWVEIPNSNSETYDPGMLTESRCFLRCARNQGCQDYIGESNVVCITILPALEIECSSISGDCGNGNMASASVEVLNGTEPYTYAWSNGATTAEITGLAEGTYTVTVTDVNGCTATCTESVIVTPCCNVTDPGEIAGEQSNCTAFDPDPIVSVAPATGGIGPVEYMWLQGDCNTDPATWTPIPGAHGESYDPGMLTETTCFRRCARNNGCEPWIGESNIITITIQNALTIECSSISGDCGNGNVASASVEVIDGTAPFTYEWSNGETTAEITGLAEGSYTVTVTDANGCTASCSESVIVTPCCNVTDPGEIAANQENCGAFDPAPITSVAPATGGIGPVEYMWLQGDCNTDPATWSPIPGAHGESYDPGMLTETTCFRRCARNNGCEPWIGESNIITITVYPAIELTCNGVDGTCNNGNVARAIAHISGGTEPFSVLWSNGETTATIDSLEAGSYTVTVTDANGCEATCTTSVSVTPCCNVTDGGEIAESQENCGPFDPDPIVSVTPATGGIGPVEYAWYSGPCPGNDPTFGQTAIPAGFTLIAGATGESYDPELVEETTCYIRVARNQGCEEWIGESNIVSITVNPNPVAQCTSENGTCENGNVGSASVTVSGGPSPFTYAWSTGETTASISDLAEGTYSVVVTDGNGCVDSCSTAVEVVPCCNVTDGGEIAESQENCGPFDAEEIVSVTPATGGIGPVEYAWYSGPCPGNDPTIGAPEEGAIPAGFTLIAGATGESYDPGLVEETTCYIRVARNQGCTDWIGESNIVSIVINAGPVVQCTSENGNCENGNVGSASVNVTTGESPFTYAWSNGGTGASISQLEPGTYSVVVTDANGCVDSCSVEVENEGCCNVTDGGEINGSQENCGPFDASEITSITPATGGIGPVEYAWYSGPCPANDPTIGAPAQEAIPAGFTLIAGATGESYDPGLVEETTCYIRVARNQGCTDWIGESNIVTVTIFAVPEVDVVVSGGVNPSCSGETVELTAQASSSVSYEWSTGATSSTIEVSEEGAYIVTVWDVNGCSATDSIDVELYEEPEVEIEITGTTPFCEGDSVLLTAVCETAAGYSWSTGATGSSIWVTEAGTYEVEVVDTNGCTASTGEKVEVFELPEVEITIDGNNPLCDGDSALLTAVSQGAIGYEWSTGGATTQSIWVYEAGTYTVTVVDEGGCENNTSFEIEEGLSPLIEITGDTIACAGGEIELTAQYAGGEGVLWSTGEITQTIVVTEAGEYCVSTTSIDGCEASACINIDFYATPEVEVEVTAGNNPLCPGGEVEVTAVSQNAVSHVWSTQETSSSITVTEAGTYSVEITDANGCSAEGSIEVEEGLVPLVEITGETEFCTGDSVMLTAQYAGGEGVTWSTGETTQNIWVSEEGQYCVTTASIDGCEAQACIEVEEAAIPEVYAGPDLNICDGDSIMLTATGGTTGTVYTWYVDGMVVGTGMSILVSPEVGITEYTVVAENENCSISDEDHIKVYVYEYPIAGFERDPAGDVPFGSDVQFTDTTLGNVTDWHWDFGDGMTSMLQNPDHNYADPGSYWVELIASNNGCSDTATAGLEVKIIIDIPNVFTPNNDGTNDVIWLQGTDLNMIKMTIYNRWGHSVYASEGRQFSWSGKTTEGVDCEAGTYYYVIEMEYRDGNVSEQTGFFTLIRN